MTYRFKCREAADVLMLQRDGDNVLRLIGREPADKGVITPPQLPEAIAAIERAIAQEGRLERTAATPAADEAPSDTDTGVTLGQRAWPFLQLLKAARATATEITWGV